MKGYVFDVETNGFLEVATKVWCIVTKDLQTREKRVYSDITIFKHRGGTLSDFRKLTETHGTWWIAHNGLAFDFPVLTKLLGVVWDFDYCIDTFVVSRLVNYSNFSTHSIEEYGKHFKLHKGGFKDFSQYSEEMVTYCIRDVDVNFKIWDMYKAYFKPGSDWWVSLKAEQAMVLINEDMRANGFKFNKDKAEELLLLIKAEMYDLEEKFRKAWPDELAEHSRIKFGYTKEGKLHANVQKSYRNFPKCVIDGEELVRYDYKSFKAGSPIDRIDKLTEAGWKPFVKTKTHNKFTREARPGKMWGKKKLTKQEYEEKKKHFDKYGWQVCEENLQTVPDSAPEAAKSLAQWLTLEGRRSSLEEWLGCLSTENRIHGKFWNIGAWTHRMSHSSPNQANIFSPFHGEAKTPVEEIKKRFDADLRALWCVEDGVHLVGTDAEGIQLRILAHYLKSDDYVHAIVSGKKEDATDIHNLNLRALGLNHLTRDNAKTFIYAWLLGAGTAKVASILSCSHNAARSAVQSFIESTTGLAALKNGQIVRDARRGYFQGLDKRKVLCDSDHLMLAGYLQNGEAVIMKHANILWREMADKEKIKYKQVDFVHDEWQTECHGSLDMAERLGELQRESIRLTGEKFNVYCPLAGSTDIGSNWLETH